MVAPMRRALRRGLLVALAVGAGALAAILATPAWREELRSLDACRQLAHAGFRVVADDPRDRFLGKVKAYTALCRGGDRALANAATPWVDWTDYWGTGDASSRSHASLLPFAHLARDDRGLDGALLDLEYQRIELLKLNLFDNSGTYPTYVEGLGGVPGRAVSVWPQMRLPPEDPHYAEVGGDGRQRCRGELVRYRTLTGICNDVDNPLMGSTGMPFARNVQLEETFPDLATSDLVRNRHGDRIGLLRPDPQVISRELLTRQQSDPGRCADGLGGPRDPHCDYLQAPFFNVLAAFWIQFMTHDWFAHLDEGHNAPAIEEMGCRTRRDGDGERPLTAPEVAALGCRPDDRIDSALVAQTEPAPTFTAGGTPHLARAPRTTANNNTAWWDASQIYGFSERSRRRVHRDPHDPARLLMVQLPGHDTAGDRQGYLPTLGADDPIHPAWTGQEAVAFPDNWSVGLSLLHNVFAREHNLFVAEFRRRAALDPDADSGLRDPARPRQVIRYRDVTADQLFEVARLVVAAEIAKIHTVEWTTQLLYDEPLYRAMNANWFGLVRGDGLLRRALERVAVDRLGTSVVEGERTAWYSVFASGAGIFGLGSHRYAGKPGFLGVESDERDLWDVGNLDDLQRGVNHFGSPFNFPEEFVTVYRLHPLVPDLVDFRDWHQPNAVARELPVVATFRGAATAAMHDGGLTDWVLSLGRQRLGALTLGNHPRFLQNLPMPRLGSASGKLDVPALDILRDRERGVPRYNEFRRQYGLRSVTSFDDFVDWRLPPDAAERRRQEAYVGRLREVYGTHVCDDRKAITAVQDLGGRPLTDCLGHADGSRVDNVEDLDVVVGFLAEGRRPHGFAISETQFTVFILNASRRLFSDRFFTSSFRPEIYSSLGVEWVTHNGPDGRVMEPGRSNGHEEEVSPFKRVLLRTLPELAPQLAGVVNVFDPWGRDRDEYYSLAWAPRAGAEGDPAFARR